MRLAAAVLAGLVVAGCGSGTLTPTTATPPSAPAAATTPAPSPAGPAPNEAEAKLIAGMRTDLTDRCAPSQEDLPGLAIAQIECTPESGVANRAWVTVFESQEAMLAAYTDIVTSWGLRIPHEGPGCPAGGGSEGSYLPGDGQGVLLPQRHACQVFEDALVRTATTIPPYVLVTAEGGTDDRAALERWAFLGNKDTPGGPTVWSAFGPQSPEQ
ncbi:MAG TPA: hypothetical protein VFY23_10865 [Candidatus Limnocylindrales bacterium]|nr:hypothetical protein [Candidatus Limnocylindrales bacterium]